VAFRGESSIAVISDVEVLDILTIGKRESLEINAFHLIANNGQIGHVERKGLVEKEKVGSF
jgi:hypothetical protein